jgi:NTP pyrophosphatase (non-canonical NTP hydrolase)
MGRPYLAMSRSEQEAWGQMSKELKRAKVIHPSLPADPNRRLRILVEEVGEVAQAIDQDANPHRSAVEPTGPNHYTKEELAQVAATAIRWIAAIIEEEDANAPRQRKFRS